MTDPRLELMAAMRDNPKGFLAFAKDHMGITLWEGQEKVYYSAFENPETYVLSGNGTGKTYVSGLIGLAFLICKQPSKVVFLATKLSQAKRQAWAEFQSHYRKLRDVLLSVTPPLELPSPLAESVTFQEDWFATIWTGAANDPEAFRGFHAKNLIFIVDEASGVGDDTRDSLGKCVTSADNHIVAMTNPSAPMGWFYEGYTKPLSWRKTIHLSPLETPNVVLGEEVYPGMATRGWVERIKEEFGEDSSVYQMAVLGQYPTESQNSVFPFRAVTDAPEKGLEGVRRIGVDVARYGDDNTVATLWDGLTVKEVRTWKNADTMETCGRLVGWLRESGASIIGGEETGGLGAGVLDRLKELGIPARGWVSGAKASDPVRFANLKAEVTWKLREDLIQGKIGIPKDARELRNDMLAMTYKYDGSSGRLRIVDPPNSPDFFDSALVGYWVGLNASTGKAQVGAGTMTGKLSW
ncbi:MAG: terminase family protein [Candidatus Thermoplasmatota archaeon]|nr:terminase family protein [Candidatus Thermoplasmatota archaeon]